MMAKQKMNALFKFFDTLSWPEKAITIARSKMAKAHCSLIRIAIPPEKPLKNADFRVRFLKAK